MMMKHVGIRNPTEIAANLLPKYVRRETTSSRSTRRSRQSVGFVCHGSTTRRTLFFKFPFLPINISTSACFSVTTFDFSLPNRIKSISRLEFPDYVHFRTILNLHLLFWFETLELWCAIFFYIGWTDLVGYFWHILIPAFVSPICTNTK